MTDVWYMNSRLGVNSLSNIMKNMVDKKSGKRFTNHSARKTLVKKLKKAKVQKSDIIGITGHTTALGLDP